MERDDDDDCDRRTAAPGAPAGLTTPAIEHISSTYATTNRPSHESRGRLRARGHLSPVPAGLRRVVLLMLQRLARSRNGPSATDEKLSEHRE